jgi:hypothetical protein
LRVLKEGELKSTLYQFHASEESGGHRGIQVTLHKMNNYYWFPNMTEIVTAYVNDCSCQKVSLFSIYYYTSIIYIIMIIMVFILEKTSKRCSEHCGTNHSSES